MALLRLATAVSIGLAVGIFAFPTVWGLSSSAPISWAVAVAPALRPKGP